jgi:hypothetical protein
MATRSTQLWAAALGQAVDTLLFTVPADRVCILKSIYMNHNAGTEQRIDHYIAAGEAAVRLTTEPVNALALGRWDGWALLNPGDTVRVTFAAAPIYTVGSGSLLPLPGS